MASSQVLVLVILCALRLAAAAAASAAPSLSFSLTHRDAPRSLIRNGALEEGIPPGLPLRDLLVAGRAMRERATRATARARRQAEETRFSYLNESVGDFYLTASVGTPPQQLVFIVDSGSELTWTQCRPCLVCSAGGGPSFAFSKSSSYRRVPCLSPLCSQSLGFAGGACSNSSARSCVFQLRYGDGSEDDGYLSVDTFHFGRRARPATLVFGCSVINVDAVPSPNSGIAGINNGPYSFSSQVLRSHSHKKFAYCLPDRITNLNSSGALIFGDYSPPAKLQYTPLVPPYSPMGDLYYYIGVTGVTVGGRRLRLELSALEPDEFGTGGTVLDSGTAITHFVQPVYKAVVGAMVEETAHMRPYVEKELGIVCYNISADAQDLPRVPDVTLHLAGGVDMVWDYRSLLFAAAVSGDVLVVCLALANSGATAVESLNIIGNFQQQNYWVEYDVQSSRVGLARADCATRK